MGQIADVSTPKTNESDLNTFLDTSVIRKNPFCINEGSMGDSYSDFQRLFNRANGKSQELFQTIQSQYKRHFFNLEIIMSENNIGFSGTVRKELKIYTEHKEENVSETYNEGGTYPSKIMTLKKNLIRDLVNNNSQTINKIEEIISNNQNEYSQIKEICNEAYIRAITRLRNKKHQGIFNSVGRDDIIIAGYLLYSSVEKTPINIVSADQDFHEIAKEIKKLINEFEVNFKASFFYMKNTEDGVFINYKGKIIK
jgi:hypothetical protein